MAAVKHDVIFLDVDGVLNYRGFLKKGQRIGTADQLCPERVARLRDICDQTGAVIVLSSTWRLNRTTRSMQASLARRGLRTRIIGATPALWGDNRGDEIVTWLDVNRARVNRFCIIDDDPSAAVVSGEPDVTRELQARYVRTYYDVDYGDGGIQVDDIDQAVRILRG